MNKLEKMYAVEFMRYDNKKKTIVSYTKNNVLYKMKVGKDIFLVPESRLEMCRKYGHGYRSIKCVGQFAIPEDADITENTNYTITETVPDEGISDDNLIGFKI